MIFLGHFIYEWIGYGIILIGLSYGITNLARYILSNKRDDKNDRKETKVHKV